MYTRVDGLNFIRIIGMTMILLFHAWLMHGFHVGIEWLDQLISIGAIFVTVFFMLSGFGLRKNNRDLSVRDFRGLFRFYKKRVLSFYPLFLLLVVVALVFQFRVADSWIETIKLLPIELSGLHILFGKEMHGFLFNDNCWYISALLVLYLLFPFLNAFVGRFSKRAKVCLCLVLWLVSSGVYMYLVFGTKLVFLDYYPNPFLRIPEFMIGMLLADVSEEFTMPVWWRGWVSGLILAVVFVVANVGLLAMFPYCKQETNLYSVIVIPCTAICFLVMANWDGINRVGRYQCVRWLAGLGLEMYLCQSLATLVLNYVKVDGRWDEVAFIGLTVAFAVVVNRWFSRWIMKKARK